MSWPAKIFFFMQMSFILISVGNFVLATLPQYRDDSALNTLPIPSPDSKQFPFFVVEIFCILYFVLELLIRFWVALSPAEFFADIL
ncbi:Oidioi.mRNA.OKI2018_I69.XSR.g13704.t1.cds [Oikopleura dioica]|uniref:Oidioi.mRNA.OKI2018_I69.XSR.g13704.t1.cds n=1 Tax=Oikopleura dioica TaxID=34765 RepID=A0ABN7SCE5_OIKDI|nr:Oidioi.mRNA.OKI2018_I69.XSR.g13704.t1.cds [Oikopleura dioica]